MRVLRIFRIFQGLFDKMENTLIKHYVPGNVHPASSIIKAFVALMSRAIANEGASFGSKIELSLIIWPHVRPAGTSKHSKHSIIRSFAKKLV
jgi:hypothetical protein